MQTVPLAGTHITSQSHCMIKRILVVVDASPRSAVRLKIALALARVHDGELTALYGVQSALLVTPWASGEGMAAAVSALAELDEAQRQRAQAVFRQTCSGGRATWLNGGSMPYATLLRHALVHDLLVLGQSDPHDGQTGVLPVDLVPSAITDSGRPTLMVPAGPVFADTEGPVVVAWKPTREAARAITAALPWLRRAPRVHLAMPADDDTEPPTAATLEHWLRVQGVAAPLQRHTLPSAEAGPALLGLAAVEGAALLVMGCYGHSRAREWAMGGVTRSVLRDMHLPVLMVH